MNSHSPADTTANTASPSSSSSAPATLPSIFLAHGSPLLLDDATWVRELGAWGARLSSTYGAPRAVLMASAHWLEAPVTLGATTRVPLLYDFYGFPSKYYEVTYPAPGAPELAQRIRELLGTTADDPSRGLDHGAYVPLSAMYPGADIPVLQISIPSIDPATLLALGRGLAQLRREGVLIVGSGFLTHNMHAIDWEGVRCVPSWASEFDAWCKEVLVKRDVDALLEYRSRAPGVRMALPTHEHFVPVIVAMAASMDAPEAVSFPIEGFAYGSFTKRSVQFG